ncbi:MAG: hypothetical protein HYX80_06800 [Chloroflexi bacterium]|nr:hypothetical protein [Chloroflexota bacterium]
MKRIKRLVRLPFGIVYTDPERREGERAQDKTPGFAWDKLSPQVVRLRSPQAGQAMLFALILLAIGALVVVPALRLSSTSLKSSQVIVQRSKALYATDAAQEYVMWKLLHTDYTSNFTYNGQSDNFTIDVCGSPVPVTVVMRAIPTWRGVTLIKNTPIKPTKTVSGPVDGVYTYTIKLEQISNNTSQGLDAVYDVLPSFTSGQGSYGSPYYDYRPGSSFLRVDGGQWQPFADPSIENGGSLLHWPATYVWNNTTKTGTGGFTWPTSNFTVGQVKEIRFDMKPSINLGNSTYYNWVVLKPWNTLSGPSAPIVAGSGATLKDGLLNSNKTAVPSVILPGATTTISYTISLTSLQQSTLHTDNITDYLPPGFSYILGSTNSTITGLTTADPTYPPGTVNGFAYVNGVYRQTLIWSFSGQLASGTTRTLAFKAVTSQNVSGSYYNEVSVAISPTDLPQAFKDIDINATDFSSGYTWNSAPVIVPAYDSSATSGNVTTNANLSISTGGGAISSYQIR